MSKLPIPQNEYDRLVSGDCDRSTVCIYLDALDAGKTKPESYAIAWEELRDQWRMVSHGLVHDAMAYVQECSGKDWHVSALSVKDELIKMRRELVDEIYEVEK